MTKHINSIQLTHQWGNENLQSNITLTTNENGLSIELFDGDDTACIFISDKSVIQKLSTGLNIFLKQYKPIPVKYDAPTGSTTTNINNEYTIGSVSVNINNDNEYTIEMSALLHDLLGETGRNILMTRAHIYMALKDTPEANLDDLAQIVGLTPAGIRHNILAMDGYLPKIPPPRFWQIPEREGMMTLHLR